MAESQKKSIGRPSMPFDQDVADLICDETCSSNKSLKTILKENPTFPKTTTIFKWLNENQEFANNYARAKMLQADYLAEEILEIADDSSNDTVEGEYGPMENKEWVNRSKLRVDARKWIASKLKPNKYGDKLDVTTDGEKINGPQKIEIVYPDDDDDLP